jgi:hypothetical protein
MSHLSGVWFAIFFCQSVACLFILLTWSFAEQNVKILVRSNLSNFPFMLFMSSLRTLSLALGPQRFSTLLYFIFQMWSLLSEFLCKVLSLVQSSLYIPMMSTYSNTLFMYFWHYWGLNSGSCTCWVGAIPLEPHFQPLFALVIFQIGSCIFAQGQPPTMIPLPVAFHIARTTGLYHHACLFLKWVSLSFVFWLASNHNLPDHWQSIWDYRHRIPCLAHQHIYQKHHGVGVGLGV